MGKDEIAITARTLWRAELNAYGDATIWPLRNKVHPLTQRRGGCRCFHDQTYCVAHRVTNAFVFHRSRKFLGFHAG